MKGACNLLIDTYGVVVCGGNSARMGTDKSMLQYYAKPQRYHVYDMLQPFCEKVFISCNAAQVNSIVSGYDFIEDDAAFENIGPMAALLTACAKFPGRNLLLIGCDYPFLTAGELQRFTNLCKDAPAGFYNEEANIYEPILAWYPSISFEILEGMHKAGQFSLQHFLQDTHAVRYYPSDKNSITSVDTKGDFVNAVSMLTS